MGKTLSIQNVNKSFTVDGQKVDVLKDINLEVQEGEFIAIVGHSGCGKSTLLKIIAGLEKNDTILRLMEFHDLKSPVYVGDTMGDFLSCQKAKVPFVFASYGFGDVPDPDFQISCPMDLTALF